MKAKLTLLILTLFLGLTVQGQNLLFIGEYSFQCTETLTFESNTRGFDDLNVLFAKDGAAGLIAVIAKADRFNMLSERLIIYLEDGTVINCTQRKAFDYVDNLAKAAFLLTSDQIAKLKNSNIHTIRYSLELRQRGLLIMESSRTASNKGISTTTLASDFFGN